MYLNLTVPMPSEKGKLTTKTIKNTSYVYYEISRTYDSDKKYNSPKRVCIGKRCPDSSGMIIPNTNFLRYFPEVALAYPFMGTDYKIGFLEMPQFCP